MSHARHGKAFVAPAAKADIGYLASRLREEDVRECEALGCTPLDALRDSFNASTLRYSIISKGKCIGMFGAAPSSLPNPTPDIDVGPIGHIWLLGSPEIKDIRYTFLRQCAHWVGNMHDKYPILWNWADSRNDLHLKWLRWLGFKIIGTHPIGINGEPFHQFVSIRTK